MLHTISFDKIQERGFGRFLRPGYPLYLFLAKGARKRISLLSLTRFNLNRNFSFLRFFLNDKADIINQLCFSLTYKILKLSKLNLAQTNSTQI